MKHPCWLFLTVLSLASMSGQVRPRPYDLRTFYTDQSGSEVEIRDGVPPVSGAAGLVCGRAEIAGIA